MTEKQLIQKCIRSDKNAQYHFYQTHKVFLWGICSRYSKRKDEAEDMLQEGFFQIFKNLHQFSGKSSLKAWMRKVMVNTALMHIRKHRNITFVELHDKYDDSNIIQLNFPSLNEANKVVALIRQLPDPFQTVFNLKAMEEFSFKEIQEKLDINESTLRSYYHRAKAKLREIYNNELNQEKKNKTCTI